jgi:hypothetical protein
MPEEMALLVIWDDPSQYVLAFYQQMLQNVTLMSAATVILA